MYIFVFSLSYSFVVEIISEISAHRSGLKLPNHEGIIFQEVNAFQATLSLNISSCRDRMIIQANNYLSGSFLAVDSK